MLKDEQYVRVQNLTDSPVVYLLPEDNLRRVYQPYEEKNIQVKELRKVFWQPGGPALVQEFLQIKNKELAEEFGVDPETFAHEYSWDKEKVDKVLLSEDIDVLHDALDFAPEGIIDLITSEAVALRIPDVNKRNLIQEYTGKDINQMISMQVQLEKALGDDKETDAPKRRRVQETKETGTGAADDESLFASGRRVK